MIASIEDFLDCIEPTDVVIRVEKEPIQDVFIDTRQYHQKIGHYFFCLPGQRFTIYDLLEKINHLGISQVVTWHGYREIIEKSTINANFYFVDDTIDALQRLSIFHRNKFSIPVIGITGSNGKTTVKEWLYEILHEDFKVCITPKSYNSQIGVALSVLKLKPYHNLAIFEAGISKYGEMEKLARMIQPTLGLFLNLGQAHSTGFKSKQDKLKEKLKLFEHCPFLINKNFQDEIEKHFKPRYFDRQTILEKLNLSLQDLYRNLTTQDYVSLENRLSVCLILDALNLPVSKYLEKIQNLQPIKMRTEIISGNYDIQIINDTYSSDAESLIHACSILDQINDQRKKSLVVTDFHESQGQEIYQVLRQIIQNQGFYIVVTIGEMSKIALSNMKIQSKRYHYETVLDFEQDFDMTLFAQQTVLFKGTKRFRLDRLVRKIQRKTHDAQLLVNLSQIRENIQILKNKLNTKTKLMLMLKANAYGVGSLEIAKTFEDNIVDYFAVAYLDEAIKLRNKGIVKPILLINPNLEDIQRMINYQIQVEIFSISQLKKIAQIDQSITIHLKIDTGMHRLGFDIDERNEIFDILEKNPQIKVESIFSHLAASEEKIHDKFTKSQAHLLKDFYEDFLKHFPEKPRPFCHILNSQGIKNHIDLQEDIVRVGIGMFGIGYEDLNFPLKLKANIVQIKTVAKGESIGYGRKGLVQENTKIAIVNIGYADGYSRIFGNGKAQVYINGKRYNTIGQISMDLLAVDLKTDEIEENTEVELFGEHIPIEELSELAQTIPYEMLTRISSRIPKVYFFD
ncbi:MAG: alanine racemase [Chitinophagales bacterium]|jgi:alanine racemase|nr:alanine racemase [Chitinophagales bacterium]